MLRWSRRKLRLIRYYSASREQTIWSKASDGALLLSIVLAFPAALVADRIVSNTETVHSIGGQIQKSGDDFTAHVSKPDQRTQNYTIPDDELWALYTAAVDRRLRGFPLTTSEVVRRPVISISRAGSFRTRAANQANEEAGKAAVVQALTTTNISEAGAIAARFRNSDETVIRQYPWAWLASSLLWSIALFVLFSVLILFTRMGAILFFRNQAAREAARISQGQCPHCGYDLRGLEFSDRCPECGSLQH